MWSAGWAADLAKCGRLGRRLGQMKSTNLKRTDVDPPQHLSSHHHLKSGRPPPTGAAAPPPHVRVLWPRSPLTATCTIAADHHHLPPLAGGTLFRCFPAPFTAGKTTMDIRSPFLGCILRAGLYLSAVGGWLSRGRSRSLRRAAVQRRRPRRAGATRATAVPTRLTPTRHRGRPDCGIPRAFRASGLE